MPLPPLPEAWQSVLANEPAQPYFEALDTFVTREYATETVYPPRPLIFRALELTPPEAVRVVILGQDPYPNAGQAHGLCFSVPAGVEPPPSLRNIFRELAADTGVQATSTDLTPWAEQGVLLLNTVLTVRAGEAGSHRGHGWERFTDAAIRGVSAAAADTVFVLWGKDAQAKRALVDETRHTVLTAAHPSPLAAWRGFFGSRPFTRANAALKDAKREPVDWSVIE
ncbi:MAG: uracil-DNA glycosylase [Gemmatimonadota bacterium]|jgi:uracil-DNA glycosylase